MEPGRNAPTRKGIGKNEEESKVLKEGRKA